MRYLLPVLVACFLTSAGLAQPRQSQQEPTLLSAASMNYDQELGVVVARGSVEIAQGDRLLLADQVTYNERDSKVTASGNVSIMEPNGDVMFADYVELTDELRNGFIGNVRVLMANNARMAAVQGRRADGNRTVMEKAVYSPCNLCADNPEKAPTWQVRAAQAVHNQEAKTISYRDATLEAFGIPVFYTPYFEHPDPTVKRQSGFLPPSLSRSSFFGTKSTTPYYWAIDEESDATVTPQMSSEEGLQMAAEYRRRFGTGEFKMDGSATYVDERDANGVKTGRDTWRGHFRANARMRPSDDTLTGFDIFRASDDTYTRRYNIQDGALNTLTSHAYVHSFSGRNYLGANAYAFQGLRVDDSPGQSPYVLPMAEFQWFGEPGESGGRFGFEGSLLSIYRNAGTDTRRLASRAYWTLPYTTDNGQQLRLTTGVRVDGYWISEFLPAGAPPGANEDALVGRVRPNVQMDWRWPFVRNAGAVQQIVEPIVVLTASPYGGNLQSIPNEDSQTFEFDETNLFAENRFPGVDRVDGGPRAAYGVRLAALGTRGGFTELLVGQSYRLNADDTFQPGSGLSENVSDYVGRLTIAPTSYIQFMDRFRIDANNGALRKHEIGAAVGPPNLRFSAIYTQQQRGDISPLLDDQQAISAALVAQLGRYYAIQLQHVHDLGPNSGALRSRALLRYEDECLGFDLFIDRSYAVDRDIRAGTTFGFALRLLTFG